MSGHYTALFTLAIRTVVAMFEQPVLQRLLTDRFWLRNVRFCTAISTDRRNILIF